ncbi:MAG: hypothetical protein QOH96_3644 [Blastocatellia bacterium]|nr:hypothetical protein [Blastocatellia bacterium]
MRNALSFDRRQQRRCGVPNCGFGGHGVAGCRARHSQSIRDTKVTEGANGWRSETEVLADRHILSPQGERNDAGTGGLRMIENVCWLVYVEAVTCLLKLLRLGNADAEIPQLIQDKLQRC